MQRLRRFLHWLRTRLIRLVIGRRSVVANVVFEDQGNDRFTIMDEGELLAFGNSMREAERFTLPEFSRN
jgi:hypothetical protein